jgi:VanZ family protein
VAIIFILSSFSKLPTSWFSGLSDKLLHFIEYTLLAVLFCRALNSMSWPKSWWSIWLTTIVIVTCLGGLDELYQSKIPGRDSDILDLVADTIGAIFGSGLYLFIIYLLGRNKGNSAQE